MMNENKWLNGAIPALLIHSCIGSVYCWSLLKADIATAMNVSVSSIEFAFALAIFSLGMSAAFGGKFVEKNVKKASFLSMCCFCFGLLFSCYAIEHSSIIGLFLSYGLLMGIGLGIGYLSPVKTLMLWFKEHKGLATGIAISGFGLSKMLFSPFIEWCTLIYGVQTTLYSISLISLLMMGIASIIIKKPSYWKEEGKNFGFADAINILKDKRYIMIWLIFFINIMCGLVIISFEKNLLISVGFTSIGIWASLTAFFNTFGRFGYSALSDYTIKKESVYEIIFGSCMLITLYCSLTDGLNSAILVLMLISINMGYGGGFSTLPNLLSSKFGMEKISTIHGFALSAWAWASIGAYILTQLTIYYIQLDYQQVICILAIMYLLAYVITYFLKDTPNFCPHKNIKTICVIDEKFDYETDNDDLEDIPTLMDIQYCQDCGKILNISHKDEIVIGHLPISSISECYDFEKITGCKLEEITLWKK